MSLSRPAASAPPFAPPVPAGELQPIVLERRGPKTTPPFGPNIIAAVLCAIFTLAYAGSFGQLVFDGALAPYVGRGILAALVSSVAVLLVLSWRSSFEFTVGGPDSNPSAVLAITLASIAQELSAATGP